MSLGGLAQLAAARGDTAEALDLYRRSLAAFEAVGDRAEEARFLGETAWTHLAGGEIAQARSDLPRVGAGAPRRRERSRGRALARRARGDGGGRGRHATAVQIAAAAEVYAQQEGIAMIYADDAPGHEYVERARATLSDDEVSRSNEAGRRLSISQTLDLARAAETQSGEGVFS